MSVELSTSTNPDVKRSHRRLLHVSLPLIVAFSVAQLSKTSIGVVVANSSFSNSFHLAAHPGAVGWLTSLFLYVYGVSLLVWGFIVKRIGPRKSMLTGTALWVIALGLTPFCSTIGELDWTRVLLGVGEGCFYPVAHTLTARWFPIQERARANASWLSGIFVGSAIATSLTTVLLISSGWRLTFFVQAAIALVFGFGFVLFFVKDGPRNAKSVSQFELEKIEADLYEETNRIPKRGERSPFRNYRYWLTMLMYLGGNIPFYGIVAWLPLFLKDGRHMHFGLMGLILTIANGLSIAVMFLVGMYSDRKVRRAGAAAIGFSLEGIGIIGAILFPNPYSIATFVFLALAGNAWCIVTNWSLLHSLMPTSQVESSSGLFSSLTNIVGAGVPALMGWILYTTHSFSLGFGVLLLSVVISVISCLILLPQGY